MLEIEELLNERKDYMRETCPAYRLVCAEHEALVEILGSWPGISEAFRSYEAYRHMVALRYCAACYQKNKKLSDLSAEGIFTYGEDDISQEKILASPQAEDKAERTAFRMLSRLVAEKGKPLSSFWTATGPPCYTGTISRPCIAVISAVRRGRGRRSTRRGFSGTSNRTGNMNKKQVSRRDTCFFLCLFHMLGANELPPAPRFSPRAKTLVRRLSRRPILR